MEGLHTSSCSSELFREIAPIGDIEIERDINTDSGTGGVVWEPAHIGVEVERPH